MTIPLEDAFNDVIGKAQRGLGISDGQLAAKTGLASDKIRAVRNGEADPEMIARIAPALALNARALLDLACGAWQPKPAEITDGLADFNSPFDDMTVNSYLVWDPATHQAAAFDTGSDCTEMLALVAGKKLSVEMILLTHTHGDHVLELDRLKERTSARAFVSEREPIHGAEPFAAGKKFRLGSLLVETFLTSGHSPGGITYFISGLARPVAIVGDSIFAGSMGGGAVSYDDALRNNREKILILPEETIICPGHGPLTSVGEELVHNPFFASTL